MSEDKSLNNTEKKLLLDLARKTIKARLMGMNPPDIVPESDKLKEPRGAFVTLHKNGQLLSLIHI